jgi:hypothetical protein
MFFDDLSAGVVNQGRRTVLIMLIKTEKLLPTVLAVFFSVDTVLRQRFYRLS